MAFTQHLNKSDEHYSNDLNFCLKVEDFLKANDISIYKITKIASDASKRYYYRVITAKKNYILMDSNEEPKSLKEFINIGRFLLNNNLSAPKIYSQNIETGLLLLEDLGTDSYTKFLEYNPHEEIELYYHAVDVLINISKLEINLIVQKQNEDLLNQGLAVFFEWYLMKRLPANQANSIAREIYIIFNELYLKLNKLNRVLALRDYHADNLMWLPHNSGINKVGILDFQDAALGFPAYDLVSLLEDARRDLKPETVSLCKEKFFASFSHIYRDNLEDAYAILGLQRNLRIIGVFHRLNLNYGKIKYTTYLPRVWNYVKQNLNYPLLKPIQEIIHKYNLYEF